MKKPDCEIATDGNKNPLTLPDKVGQQIVQSAALLACPLLGTDRFVEFCVQRGLTINRERLIRFERMGVFSPIFRVRTPDQDTPPFYIPMRKEINWFAKKWAWDTAGIYASYQVPDENNRTQEGYYSVFQIDHLHILIQTMTLQLHIDSFVDRDSVETVDWHKHGNTWTRCAEKRIELLRAEEYRRSVPLLCQYISNRYYPQTQGDQRTIQVSQGVTYSDNWITVFAHNWNWHEEVRNWDPQKAVKLFDLTPDKLRHAYFGLSISQASCDPLERWYQLTQFISVDQRKNLKGDALRAETLRCGAHMLRLLFKDLYREDLSHPNEITGTVITHIPELSVQKDPRRYLEFVVNRFGINPQPKLCLILEGQSEEVAVENVFKQYFGAHPGKLCIEVIVLHGVDVATGTKKDDNFRAIIRLIDYLHHHQTITFLILDNENYAKKLKRGLQKAKSIHSGLRYVTRPEYIKIWKCSFEFDNFSCSEIAAAMNMLSKGNAQFNRNELANCKKASNPGASIRDLFKQKTNYGLEKIKLAELLIGQMLSLKSRRKIENRPIVSVLQRVANLAFRNPLPTMHGIWEMNQASKYLGKKRR